MQRLTVQFFVLPSNPPISLSQFQGSPFDASLWLRMSIITHVMICEMQDQTASGPFATNAISVPESNPEGLQMDRLT
jgi:hypothetical protein